MSNIVPPPGGPVVESHQGASFVVPPAPPGTFIPASAGMSPALFGVPSLAKTAFSTPPDMKAELRADLLWGRSGSGKTVQAGLAAWYVAMVLHKKTLLLTADGGALSKEMKILHKLKLLDVVLLPRFSNILACMDSMTQGCWPVLRPDGSYSLKAEHGANHVNDPGWYEQVGLWLCEGVSSVGDYMMPWLTGNKDANIPGAPKEHSVKDADKEYGFGGKAHYGFMGDRFYQWITWSASQKYDKVLWTAKEQRTITDKGQQIIGPDAPGQAITKKLGGWFGGCYHMDVVPTSTLLMDQRSDASMMASGKGTTVNEHRMYIMPHVDGATGVMCDAKNRLPVSYVSKLTVPYVIANVVEDANGNPVIEKCGGLPFIWREDERLSGAVAVASAQDALQDCLKALKMIPDVSEI